MKQFTINPQKVAHGKVMRAIQKGQLKRLDGSIPCVDCGDPATAYDHRDYDKPLDVEPVCKLHNFTRGIAANSAIIRR